MLNHSKNEIINLRDFENSLPMELLRAREAAMTRFRPMLRNHNLTEQQWRVIRALADFKSIDATELAQRSFLLSPSLTRILRNLEKRDLIKRFLDSSDQRRYVISLTKKGFILFSRVAPDASNIYDQIETKFSTEKMSLLYDLLNEFYNKINHNKN